MPQSFGKDFQHEDKERVITSVEACEGYLESLLESIIAASLAAQAAAVAASDAVEQLRLANESNTMKLIAFSSGAITIWINPFYVDRLEKVISGNKTAIHMTGGSSQTVDQSNDVVAAALLAT